MKIGAIAKDILTVIGGLLAPFGLFGWLGITPEMVGESLYQALMVIFPFAAVIGGLVIGWSLRGIWDQRERKKAEETEAAERERAEADAAQEAEEAEQDALLSVMLYADELVSLRDELLPDQGAIMYDAWMADGVYDGDPDDPAAFLLEQRGFLTRERELASGQARWSVPKVILGIIQDHDEVLDALLECDQRKTEELEEEYERKIFDE